MTTVAVRQHGRNGLLPPLNPSSGRTYHGTSRRTQTEQQQRKKAMTPSPLLLHSAQVQGSKLQSSHPHTQPCQGHQPAADGQATKPKKRSHGRRKKKIKQKVGSKPCQEVVEPNMTALENQLAGLSVACPYKELCSAPAHRVVPHPFPRSHSYVTLPEREADRREPFMKLAWMAARSQVTDADMKSKRPERATPDSLDSGVGSSVVTITPDPVPSSADNSLTLTIGSSESPLFHQQATVPWAMLTYPKFSADDITDSPEIISYKDKRRERYQQVCEERRHCLQQQLRIREEERLKQRYRLEQRRTQPTYTNPGS